MVKLVESQEEYTSAIAATPIVVVDFYADWCGPCKFIAPKIEEHDNELNSDEATKGKVSFLKVNVDKLYELSREFGISAMPTFFFYSGGKKVKSVVGADLKSIKTNITELLASVPAEATTNGEAEAEGEGEKEKVTEEKVEEVGVGEAEAEAEADAKAVPVDA